MIHTIDWQNVPDVITKEQFYKICHISKSTAAYLLRSGKVPCEYNGKKTRCYKIRKADVQKFLAERAVLPELYTAPKGWQGNDANNKELPASLAKAMRDFFAMRIKDKADVLTAQEVAALTGYGRKNHIPLVQRLRIETFYHRYNLPYSQSVLLDFFCSPYFCSVYQKSAWHKAALIEFHQERGKRELAAARKALLENKVQK